MPHALGSDARRRCVDHIISEVGLETVGHVRIGGVRSKGLSGGQKRRLSVAIELLGQPALLFLDE